MSDVANSLECVLDFDLDLKSVDFDVKYNSSKYSCRKIEDVNDICNALEFVAKRYVEENLILHPNGIRYDQLHKYDQDVFLNDVVNTIKRDFFNYDSSTFAIFDNNSDNIVASCSVFFPKRDINVVKAKRLGLPTEELIDIELLNLNEFLFHSNFNFTDMYRIGEIGKLATANNLGFNKKIQFLDQLFHEVYIESRKKGLTHQIVSTCDAHSKHYVNNFGFKSVYNQKCSDLISKEINVSVLPLNDWLFPSRNIMRLINSDNFLNKYSNMLVLNDNIGHKKRYLTQVLDNIPFGNKIKKSVGLTRDGIILTPSEKYVALRRGVVNHSRLRDRSFFDCYDFVDKREYETNSSSY